MDIWKILTPLIGAAALGLLGLVVYRVWARVKRGVKGHEVQMHVETDLRKMNIPHGIEAPWTFWINGTPSPPVLSGPWGNGEWSKWARSVEGTDARTTVLEVTLQAAGDGPVSIEPPEIVSHGVKERPPDGAVFGPEGLGGNGIHSRRFIFTLDGRHVARRYEDDPSDPRPSSFTLAKGETQRIHIVVHVVDGYRHLWGLEVPVIYAGKKQALSVRQPSGATFVTYGASGARRLMLVDGQWFESPVREP